MTYVVWSMFNDTDPAAACDDDKLRQLIGSNNETASSDANSTTVDSLSATMRVVQLAALTATESCAMAVEPNTCDRNSENRFLNVTTQTYVTHGQLPYGQ